MVGTGIDRRFSEEAGNPHPSPAQHAHQFQQHVIWPIPIVQRGSRSLPAAGIGQAGSGFIHYHETSVAACRLEETGAAPELGSDRDTSPQAFLKVTSSGRNAIGSSSFMLVLLMSPFGLARITGISALNSART